EMNQGAFHGKFRLPVTVDWALRMRLLDRSLSGFAVSCAGGRKDEGPCPLRHHRLEHRQRADNIVPVVAGRFTHRFIDVQKRGKMHYGRDLVAFQRVANGGDVTNVSLNELSVLDGGTVPGRKAVEDDDLVAGSMECLGAVTADVSGAACDEDVRWVTAQWRSR